MWIVYILTCVDGKFYTGCTSDLEGRLKRHHAGYVPATQNRLPLSLVTYIVFSQKQKTYTFESIILPISLFRIKGKFQHVSPQFTKMYYVANTSMVITTSSIIR